MSNPFVGEIRDFGFNFAPRGWAMCNGQLLPISQNTALFALIGTFYGGNGSPTYAAGSGSIRARASGSRRTRSARTVAARTRR
jgi:microcystin-dependent protein